MVSITSVIEQLPLKNSRFGGFLQEIRQIYETCVGLTSATTNRVVEQIRQFSMPPFFITVHGQFS